MIKEFDSKSVEEQNKDGMLIVLPRVPTNNFHDVVFCFLLVEVFVENFARGRRGSTAQKTKS